MKKLLASLLCIVFLNSSVFAISGGPTFGGAASTNVIGTYSGVLIPTAEAGMNVNGGGGGGFNSIGIFSIGVPEAGVATGSFGFFGNGQVYNGAMTGIADPGKATLNCILDAPTTLISPNGNTYIGQALGSMKAKIEPAAFGSNPRVTGNAHVDVFEGDFNADLSVAVASSFDFVVDGFKQSDTTSQSTVTLGNTP